MEQERKQDASLIRKLNHGKCEQGRSWETEDDVKSKEEELTLQSFLVTSSSPFSPLSPHFPSTSSPRSLRPFKV